jgi:hypothetical protein
MSNKLVKFLTQPLFLIIEFWILLWTLPWVVWLDSWPWLRLGLAIFCFVVPGFCVSIILVGYRLTLLSHFLSGLAFSILFVGLLGVFGRISHLPFMYIKPAFIVIGIFGSLALAFHARSGQQLYKQKNFQIKAVIPLLIIAILSILIAFWDRIGLDERVYLAYLTSWQHSFQLDFKEVLFNSGSLGGIRFWLAMFPMVSAFLSEISGIHGLLLLGFYFGPVFITIAILSAYALYDELLQSEHQTIAALVLQFTFLFLLLNLRQPGSVYFFRITEDKAFAAFILAPIFFLAVRILLQSQTVRNAIFVLFTGWSLALVHPIILTYAVMIAGIYAGIVTIMEKEAKKLIVTIMLFAAIMLPVASLRFVDVPWVSRYIFSMKTPLKQLGDFDLNSALKGGGIASRISYIKGTPFYGFNLSVVRIQIGGLDSRILVLLSWSYVWIMGLGLLWSLFNLRKHPAAPFVAATAFLVLLCALPYTGWLVGKLVSARMLWRVPWLLPIGFFTTILADEFLKGVWKRIFKESKISSKEASFGLILIICSILIIYVSTNTYSNRWRGLTRLSHYWNILSRLSNLGDYLETNINQPSRFAASLGLMDYLPGLSSKSKVIYFRNDKRTPYHVYHVHLDDIKPLLSRDTQIIIDQRVDVFVKYDIQYLITEDIRVKDYYNTFPEFFDVQESGGFWIIEFRGVDR